MAYYFKPSAVEDLKSLPKSIRRRVITKLDFYITAKHPLQFAKALKDKSFGEYRFRIGDYLFLFDVDAKNNIIVLAVGHRKDIYR
jgi:mRNA-degrading endonuclease RelE of RelBE toxin-antitoxin system